jgi:hypothetical protein
MQKWMKWRKMGVIVFALFALMELGDLVGLIPGFSEPARSQYAALIGISPDEEGTRLMILSALSLGIVVSSIVTVVVLLRGVAAHRAGSIVAAIFLCYGLYQIIAALFQLKQNQFEVAMAGGVYGLLGLLAWWVARKAAPAVTPSTTTPRTHP